MRAERAESERKGAREDSVPRNSAVEFMLGGTKSVPSFALPAFFVCTATQV